MREYFTRLSQPVNRMECQQYTDKKRCDVKEYVVSSDDSRVGVKNHGNQKSSKERAIEKRRCDTGILVFASSVHEARIDQHGEKT